MIGIREVVATVVWRINYTQSGGGFGKTIFACFWPKFRVTAFLVMDVRNDALELFLTFVRNLRLVRSPPPGFVVLRARVYY